jgi:hypothetical protein
MLNDHCHRVSTQLQSINIIIILLEGEADHSAAAGTEQRNREALSLLSLTPFAHHVSSVAGKVYLCLACYFCLPFLCVAAHKNLSGYYKCSYSEGYMDALPE